MAFILPWGVSGQGAGVVVALPKLGRRGNSEEWERDGRGCLAADSFVG